MRYGPMIFAAALWTAFPLMAEQAMPKMMYKQTETPAYQLVSAKDGIEIRQYAPRILAEVTVTGDRGAAINAGFRILAGYIFGGNAPREKVAMTSPVAQVPEKIAMTSPVTQSGSDGEWTVQFTMPSSYTMDNLPAATDPRIRFITQPSDRQIVIQFSGRANAKILAEKESELRAAAVGMDLGAGPIYYFYDAPFTLPWNRRNEVAFTLR